MTLSDDDAVMEDDIKGETVIDERKHTQLVNSILSIAGKRNRAERRTLPRKEVVPVNFDTGKGKVRLAELVGSLQSSSSSHVNLKKQLSLLTSRGKVVDTPLPKHQQLKVDRSIAYDDASKEFSKWSSIIHGNRKAEQIKFPLEQTNIKIHNLARATHVPRTPLEIEVAALLQTSSVATDDNYKRLTAEEKRARVAMSLAEARERHDELRKHRIRVSYRTAKETRIKKIKSRGFRRQRRRERAKEEMSALEKLKSDDPEEYLKKMDEAENARIKERLTLKHRKSSKFAKRTLAYAKHDEQARNSIKEMLEKKRELKKTQLVEKSESSSGEEGDQDDVVNDEVLMETSSNPWMKASGPPKKIKIKSQEVISAENPQLFTEVKPDLTEDELADEILKDDEDDRNIENTNVKDIEEDIDTMFDELDNISTSLNNTKNNNESKTVIKTSKEKLKKNDIKKTRKRADKNAKVSDRASDKTNVDICADDKPLVSNGSAYTSLDRGTIKEKTKRETEEAFVDPKNVLSIQNTIQSFEMPTTMEGEDSEDDTMDINEAFADDDVIDEFVTEKADHIERKKVKDIDLFLPGWGSWGGAGISVSQEKKERFTIKAPPAKPRRDSKLGNVIVNEKKDDAVAKYQVNKLPFPFKTQEQFEQSIKTPVGKTWNPETTFKELTRPKVITRLGTIIEPISKEETFKKHKSVKVGEKRMQNGIADLTVAHKCRRT